MHSIAEMKGCLLAHEQAKAQMRHLCAVGIKRMTEAAHQAEQGANLPPVRFSVIGAGEALHLLYGERVLVFAMSLATVAGGETPRAHIRVNAYRQVGLPEPRVSELGEVRLDRNGRISWGETVIDTTDPDQLDSFFMYFLLLALTQ